jgi:ferredoxin-NADP reductase
MSMIRHRQVVAPAVPALLLLSARRWVDALYRDELLDLAAQGTGLEVVLTLTREQPARPTDYGRRVDSQMMIEVIGRLPSAPKLVFICGSNPFVNAAADGTIDARVSASIVRTERYGA